MRGRYAEPAGLAAAIAVLIAYAFGVEDKAVIAALTVVVGGIPTVVTYAVDRTRQRKIVTESDRKTTE